MDDPYIGYREDLALVLEQTGDERYREPRFTRFVERRAVQIREKARRSGLAGPQTAPQAGPVNRSIPRSEKPRVPKGQPHCRECVEAKRAAEGSPS